MMKMLSEARPLKRWTFRLCVLTGGLLIFVLSGCSLYIRSATGDLTNNLKTAILDNDDPETVEAGAPAYLLLIDSLAASDPENAEILRVAATLYTAYSDVFVSDDSRRKKLTRKGLDYALRAACLQRKESCDLRETTFESFTANIQSMTDEDLPTLYTLGSAWASWIRTRAGDWDAVAELPRVSLIMTRVLQLDEGWEKGSAHLYLGLLDTLLPQSMGGKPEEGRQHFERAIALSGGGNLTAKVMYARQYARSVFDRELHDRLLQEVLGAAPEAPGFTLANVLAQKEAEKLLAGSAEYFE